MDQTYAALATPLLATLVGFASYFTHASGKGTPIPAVVGILFFVGTFAALVAIGVYLFRLSRKVPRDKDR